MKKSEPEPVPLSNMLVVDVVIHSDKWRKCHFDCEEYLSIVSQAVLRNLPFDPSDSQLELTILLADDQKLKELNLEYREIDKPTNVLSFPYINIDRSNINASILNHDSLYLGDIALSYETIERESIEQNKIFKDHLIHMLVHGILHVFGYDHENDDDSMVIEGLEANIMLKEFNIPNPYIIKI